MEGEHIAATTIPVVVEAHLDGDRPSRGAQQVGEGILELGMGCVGQPIQHLAVPFDSDAQPRAKSRHDAIDGPQRDRARLAALDAAQ